jgi:hypothetical protein
MGGACSAHAKLDMHKKLCFRRLNQRNYPEDLGVDEVLILK